MKKAEKARKVKEKAELKKQLSSSFEDIRNQIKITLELTDFDEIEFLKFKKLMVVEWIKTRSI